MTVNVEFMNQDWFQWKDGERIKGEVTKNGQKFTILAGEDKQFGGSQNVSLIISCNEANDGGTLTLLQGTHAIRNWSSSPIWPEPMVTDIKRNSGCEVLEAKPARTEPIAYVIHSER